MARVYVSSTLADLRQERQAVMDALVTLGHQPVHSYRPDSDTVRDSCLADVDGCDLYVLILGHRYGNQPAQDNPQGLSITHLEFQRAGWSGIPRIALLRTNIPDESLSDLADPARLALVMAFRDEVKREVRPVEFSDQAGLMLALTAGLQAALDKMKARPMADRRAAGPVLRLAPRSAFLTGREELLAELEARLTAGDDTRPRVVALCGLGGAGKTSVALEYAHRHLGEVAVAWQFPAEDSAVLAAAFGALAAQLGARELADARDPVVSVHGVLAAYPAPWLLVFDNARDYVSLAGFIPPAGPGRVVITSRNQIWPLGQALPVPVLDRQVAADFLAIRSADPDAAAAGELAGELGGLPLALEQAAAYVQASGSTLASYLAMFRKRRADLLGRGEPTGYPQTVATTWQLAFEDLEQTAPGAAGLLRLLAFCAPEAIPLPLLLQPHPNLDLGGQVAPMLTPLLEDELAVADAVAALRRYSLVTPAASGSVSVHRLVQAVTADQMPADLASQWRRAAAALIEAATPLDPGLPGTWPVCAALLPHAEAALNLTSSGLWRIAKYLGESGSYPAAQDLFQLIVGAHTKDGAYGPEHPETLAARGSLAYWTGQAGDAASARDQYAALLPVNERVLGPEHPDTLADRGNLARWTGLAGDAAAARKQFAALVPVSERILGPEHPETLIERVNLAYMTGQTGDAAAARDEYAALAPVIERVSGPEHPHTLTARGNLAAWTGEAGDAAAARDQYTALLPVIEQVFGTEHPHTLAARDSFARWTGRAGDAAGARDQYAALRSARTRVLGPGHPYTVIDHSNVAYWTGEAGDAADARDEYAALVPVVERMRGPEHPDTLAARSYLANWTGKAGDAVAAREQYAAVLPVRARVIGPEDRDTLADRSNLAFWTGEAGDAAAARDQLAMLLPVVERVFGPEHPDTLTVRNNLAYINERAKTAASR